jgi:hypothetical protein
MEKEKNRSTKKAFKFADRGVEIALAVALIAFIVVGVIIFLFSNRNQVNKSLNSDVQTLLVGPREILEVNDPSKVTLGNESVGLSSGWRVASVSRDYSQDEQYECNGVDQKTCTVYTVTNNEEVYFIATPSQLQTKVSVPISSEEKSVSVGGKSITFKFDSIATYKENENGELVEDESIVIYKEVYGCVSSSICISSGLLNYEDATINKSQVEKFQSFVEGLAIS